MRRAAAAGVAALAFGWGPVLSARAASSAGPAVYAAEAEAWAYSVEVGIPGPVGPLASHTTAAVDNSPHATGAAGLADPGYLIRATAGLVAGIPTPAYCESAWPEGPNHSDCGASAVGHSVGQSSTDSGDAPRATATAALGQVTPSDAAGVLTIATQSTTSAAFLDNDGAVRATADVALHGVTIAGGVVRLGAVIVHREATAGGTAAPSTSSSIRLSGVTVAGKSVDPAGDQVKSLVDAVRKSFGDTLVVEALGGNEKADAGKLTADTAGLRIRLHLDPNHSVQIVLGYGRVLVYGAGTTAGAPIGDVAAPATPSAALAPISATDALHPSAGDVPGALPALPSAALPSADATPAVPFRSPPRLLTGSPSTAVRWVSPFLVLAQMTSGGQVWWFLLGLLPLLAGAWLARRSGMGLLAPWVARGGSS